MATKTPKKQAKTAAKATPKRANSETNAVVVVALKRAISVVEKAGPKGLAPEVGGHAVALEIRIVGDITVEAPGAPGERVSVSAKDLAAALLADVPAADKPKALQRAVKLLAKAKGSERSAKTLERAAIGIDEALKVMAVQAGLVEPTPGRAGAIKGSPNVEITGTVAGNAVSLVVDREGGTAA